VDIRPGELTADDGALCTIIGDAVCRAVCNGTCDFSEDFGAGATEIGASYISTEARDVEEIAQYVCCYYFTISDSRKTCLLGLISCMQCMRCGLLLQMSHVAWSAVCMSVCLIHR